MSTIVVEAISLPQVEYGEGIAASLLHAAHPEVEPAEGVQE